MLAGKWGQENKTYRGNNITIGKANFCAAPRRFTVRGRLRFDALSLIARRLLAGLRITQPTEANVGAPAVREQVAATSGHAVSHDIRDFTARVLVASAVDTDLSSLESSLA